MARSRTVAHCGASGGGCAGASAGAGVGARASVGETVVDGGARVGAGLGVRLGSGCVAGARRRICAGAQAQTETVALGAPASIMTGSAPSAQRPSAAGSGTRRGLALGGAATSTAGSATGA